MRAKGKGQRTDLLIAFDPLLFPGACERLAAD